MSNRYFVLEKSSIGIIGYRCKASRPLDAGKKLATRLFDNIQVKSIRIYIRETTKNSIGRTYQYIAQKLFVKKHNKYKIEIHSHKKHKGGGHNLVSLFTELLHNYYIEKVTISPREITFGINERPSDVNIRALFYEDKPEYPIVNNDIKVLQIDIYNKNIRLMMMLIF